MDTEQAERVEREIIRTLDGYFETASQCDVRKFLSFFVETNEITVIENDEIHSSRKDFVEWINEFYQGIVKLDAAAEERRVFPLSPEVGVATGIFRYSAQLTSGEVVGGRNAFTFVFVRQGERWLINNVHESSLPVGATPESK